MKKKIKLSEWARLHSYTYRGAYNVFKRGAIKGEQTESGAILIDWDDNVKIKPEYNVIYTRVSSSENKPNLDSQAERVSQFCTAKGWIIHEVIKECASGLNDSRPKLQKLLQEKQATRIIVEHKDRLTRFGFNYLKTLFDGEIVVINEVKEDEQDLMQDFVSLVTSFCARLYGKRRNKTQTEKLIQELSKND
jgi:predicted site-specific integrase-resolvase